MVRACLQVCLKEIVSMDLQGFADALSKACITVVLPSLELMAAQLCGRLLSYVIRELAMKITGCFCWSAVVSCQWSCAVDYGRCLTLESISSSLSSFDSLRHQTLIEENLADLLSRGCPLIEVSSEALWRVRVRVDSERTKPLG
ncbi:Anillin-like protein [Trichinella pseudospiralis]